MVAPGLYRRRRNSEPDGGDWSPRELNPEFGAVSRSVSVLVLRWRPVCNCGPGRQTPKVGAGDHAGQDAQPAPQRLTLLGGVYRHPLVSR